jgi:type VI secretion system protein ImpM
MDGAAGIEVGFYGKLPSHGDFLRRRVSDEFVSVWDRWLQECVAGSQAALGPRWLDVYLTSPAWRFACDRGVFGQPALGLMVPSVDRVGRYFYLTLLATLPDHVDVAGAAASAAVFFENAEQLVVDTLAAATIDFESFDDRVGDLSRDLEALAGAPRVRLAPSAGEVLNGGAERDWQIPTGSPSDVRSVLHQLLSHRLGTLYDPLVIWWTDGSSMVEPNCLIGRGLPSPDVFAAFLDGSWERRQWTLVAADVNSTDQEDDGDTLTGDPSPPQYRSVGATDTGRVRKVNQDSFLERPEVGLWVVADGLGGHSEGEVASRMVCDALADLIPDASFDRMVELVTERVQQVNDHLVRAAARPYHAVISGSTVVTLLTRGTRCVVAWAGDSRVYRVRRGQLEQLTRDHSLLAESGFLPDGESPNAITRAVGGEPTLALDLYRDRVRPGDRFLLCSDGLTRTLSEERILHWMQHEYISAAVQGLMTDTLEAGAPDNVTAVIVEAYAPGWS